MSKTKHTRHQARATGVWLQSAEAFCESEEELPQFIGGTYALVKAIDPDFPHDIPRLIAATSQELLLRSRLDAPVIPIYATVEVPEIEVMFKRLSEITRQHQPHLIQQADSAITRVYLHMLTMLQTAHNRLPSAIQ